MILKKTKKHHVVCQVASLLFLTVATTPVKQADNSVPVTSHRNLSKCFHFVWMEELPSKKLGSNLGNKGLLRDCKPSHSIQGKC